MIELERIYAILTSFLGESKQGRYDNSVTQYQFNCPYCADEKGGVDGKYNLEVSLKIMRFHCWACDNSGSLSKLIRKYGGNALSREYYEIIKTIKDASDYNADFFTDENLQKEKEALKLPNTYRKINLSTCRDKKLLLYLNKRRIDQRIIDKFNIGYTAWNDPEKAWSSRLIIPSYDQYGSLNFFAGRDFLPERKNLEPGQYNRPKYKNCKADAKEIMFQESKINFDADIYLVEGAIDCIYGPNTISMLGKALSRDSYLFKTLVTRANATVTVCLDSDTTNAEIWKICGMLDTGKLSGKIRYIKMEKYKDFGEAYEKGGRGAIIELIRGSKPYTEKKILE